MSEELSRIQQSQKGSWPEHHHSVSSCSQYIDLETLPSIMTMDMFSSKYDKTSHATAPIIVGPPSEVRTSNDELPGSLSLHKRPAEVSSCASLTLDPKCANQNLLQIGIPT